MIFDMIAPFPPVWLDVLAGKKPEKERMDVHAPNPTTRFAAGDYSTHVAHRQI
jgi:hypothetical protein